MVLAHLCAFEHGTSYAWNSLHLVLYLETPTHPCKPVSYPRSQVQLPQAKVTTLYPALSSHWMHSLGAAVTLPSNSSSSKQ